VTEAKPGRRLSASDLNVTRVGGTIILAIVAIWVILQFKDSPVSMIQVTIDGILLGGLYALIALGYTMVYGIIELINFAHGDVFMLGGVFCAWLLTSVLGFDHPSVGAWIALLFTLVAAVAVIGLLNVSIEFLAYRKLRNAPKLTPLITAVGVSFILQNIGLFKNGSTPAPQPQLISTGTLDIGDISIQYASLVTFAMTIPLLLLLRWLVTSTRQGKAMRAVAQDPDASRLMGIDVNRTISFTFLIAGGMAGAAGLMYVETVGVTRYDAGFQLGLIAFTAAVLGGVGNLTGAVVGGLLIGLIQSYNDGAPNGPGQQWSQTTVFLILIVLIVFRPSGLFGSPTTEKV
jgi:branched-chain amino acid transport system permease protein